MAFSNGLYNKMKHKDNTYLYKQTAVRQKQIKKKDFLITSLVGVKQLY